MGSGDDRADYALGLARHQGGMLARRQLIQLGWTDEQIDAQLDARRWQKAGRGLYAVFTGPPTSESSLWRGHLLVGDDSAVAAGSALRALGLKHRETESTAMTICVPHRLRQRSPADLEVIRLRLMPPVVDRPRLPPIVRADHALLQAVGMTSSPAAVIGLTSAVVQQRLVRPSLLAATLERTSRQRHRKLLQQLCEQLLDGSESPLEADGTNNVLRAHGLPVGKGQVSRRSGGKKVVYDRVLVPYPVVIEFDGRLGHDDAEGRFRDMDRDNSAAVVGLTTLRFGWRDVKERPCEAALQVAATLARYGWPGEPRACGPRCAVGNQWVHFSVS